MLKNSIFRKLSLLLLSLLIVLIITLFPKKDTDNDDIIYINSVKSPIYLIDSNNYVARINILNNTSGIDENIKNIVSSLTIDSNNNIYLPDGFSAIIPRNTKLLDYELNNNILKLDFSKEFNNIDSKLEEKMIEALIYSLTEIDDVDYIMIFVEGVRITKLKNGTYLPMILDRDFGINKEYDLTSIKNVNKITTYYIASNKEFDYYVPVTKVTNDNNDKIKIIIKNLKTSPIYQTNLVSYLASSADLENYEILEDIISLSFNNNLVANINNDELIEEVKYSIYLSLHDTYHVKKVLFELPGKNISIVN